MAKEKLTKYIRFRVTESEYRFLYAGAVSSEKKFNNGGTNLSAYIRSLVLARTGYRYEEILLQNRQLIYEINKIGVNINQTTKRINAGLGNQADIEKIERMMAEVREALARYISVTDMSRKEPQG